MEENFHAKFGPVPHKAAMMPPHTVLIGQVGACVLLLVALQPPFVLAPPTHPDAVATLDVRRVVAVALLASSVTWAMHHANAQPTEALTTACELLYRAMRA